MVAADVDKDAIYFGGEHDEGITFGSDYLESTNGKLAAFIVKIDKAGVVQWTQFFNFSSYTYLYDLKVASDGSLWFTGQTGSSSFTLGSKTFSNGGGYDMFVRCQMAVLISAQLTD